MLNFEAQQHFLFHRSSILDAGANLKIYRSTTMTFLIGSCGAELATVYFVY
jgi:hypothetical protein